MNGEEERNRLKEEYKAHYLKIKELKQKLAEAERVKKIREAMHQIDPQGIIDQFDQALDKVREKVFDAEARLDMALENRADEQDQMDHDEALQKQRAAETMRQMKMELGYLNDAIEEQASTLNSTKTLGKKPQEEESLSNPLSTNNSKKTLGRPNSDQPS
jgi:SPX domain protein involved in polyphosphate accumulation